jgi:hypothetical protein
MKMAASHPSTHCTLGCVAALVSSVFQAGAVFAQEVTSRDAYTVMVAFECATYAGIAGKKTESERLFILGYETAQKFMAAASTGGLSPDEEKKIPMGILESLGGPTLEFQIGRIYSDTARRALDRVHKEDYKGNSLPIREWEFDEEITKEKADIFFDTENCTVVR